LTPPRWILYTVIWNETREQARRSGPGLLYLNIHQSHRSARTSGRVAIIGSGPSGITIAFLLSARDYDVTIFERHDKVGENITIDDLMRDGYRAIFMGTGVWKPYRLGIPGESLGNVHYAIEYLRNPDVYRLGRRLAVIGAGNVAMDVARTAIRHGCQEVFVICHLDERGITARSVEAEYARIDGARFLMKKTALRFEDEGVVLADSSIIEDAGGGAKAAVPVPGTESLLPVDSVIVAVGQGPRSVIVSSTGGIRVNDRGLVVVDELGHTSREGVFASGDVVTGAKTVVEAVKVSRRVADAMDRFIREKYG